jgi:hypothetical protein
MFGSGTQSDPYKVSMKAILLSAFVFLDGNLTAATVVAPNGLENVEGDTSAIGLFGGGTGSRTQVIYSGQQLSLFQPEGVYITELRFRMDGQYADGFSANANLEIHLSTTHANPNGLDPNFAANIGLDETVVLPRSSVPISSSATLGGPNSFSVVIPLPTAFFFRPANGNLLLDAKVYSAAFTRNLDWSSATSDGVSAAVGGISSVTAGAVSESGLITQFVFTPVPEVSPLTLMSTICAFLGVVKYVSFRRTN